MYRIQYTSLILVNISRLNEHNLFTSVPFDRNGKHPLQHDLNREDQSGQTLFTIISSATIEKM